MLKPEHNCSASVLSEVRISTESTEPGPMGETSWDQSTAAAGSDTAGPLSPQHWHTDSCHVSWAIFLMSVGVFKS